MLLALDTSTQLMSIALHDGDTLWAETTLKVARQHSALLAPMIQQTLAQVKLAAEDLNALAVSVGPGSYTGLRIGVALAKGMAEARDLPLVPVSTLETILAAQGRQAQLPLVAALPAGRKRVIWAEYQRREGTWQETRHPQISDWGQLLEACSQPCLISGEISAEGLAAIDAAGREGHGIELLPASERLRRAGTLAEIAWQRLRDSNDSAPFPASQVMPIYLKTPG